MDLETKEMADSAVVASPVTSASPEAVRCTPVTSRFYRVRYRFYMSLLAFVVAVGLPIVSIPALKHRLADRVQTLREAMAGGTIKPAVVKVGENKEPFPSEYEKKFSPPNYPKLPAYFAASQGFSGPVVSPSPAPERSSSSAPVRSARTIRIPKIPAASESQPTPVTDAQEQAAADTAGAEAQPKYQQGTMEQEAYNLLLKSNATISGMVQGSNPALKFKSWDALRREEDAYWVRLTFVSLPGNTNVEYIWQVKLLTKQITPLSYNARSLANP